MSAPVRVALRSAPSSRRAVAPRAVAHAAEGSPLRAVAPPANPGAAAGSARHASARRASAGRASARRASARRAALRAPLLALCASVLALGAAAAAPASALEVGKVELKSSYVGPVANPSGADSSPCTAEPKSPIYDNQAFDKTKAALRSSDPSTRNAPSILDVTPDLTAGAHTDLCVGYAGTPNMDPTADSTRQQSTPPTPDVLASHVDPTISGGNAVPGTGDDAKRIAIDLPAGYLGEPDRTPQCTDAQFRLTLYVAMSCPANTRVGDGDVYIQANIGTAASPTQVSMAIPGTQSGQSVRLVNLTHGPDELARLGVQVNSAITQPVKFTVRLVLAGADRHLQAVVDDVPRIAYGGGYVYQVGDDDWTAENNGTLRPGATPVGLYIESFSLRIWGAQSVHTSMTRDFGELGTDCSTAQSSKIAMTTVFGTESALSTTTPHLTGCDALAFQPTVAVTTTERKPGVPTGASVHLGFGQSTGTRVTALPRKLAVTLPDGLELGAQVGGRDGGLRLCTAAQFAATSPLASGCPASTAAADVSIASPLITAPFVGKVYLGAQHDGTGSLPDLYLDVALQGATAADAPRIKLVGTVSVSDSGQVTATFDDVPQLRFSSLDLTFPGGANALFTTPRTCGTHTGTSQLTPWSNPTAPVAVDASITIDQDCDAAPFAPTLAIDSANADAAASARTTIVLARPDRAPWFTQAEVALPTGFLADLHAAQECSPAAAATATCQDASRIAAVNVQAGAGGSPYSLTGSMYLVTPTAGNVDDAVIVVRAAVGDLDLGNVIVPATIALRPGDAGLTLRTSIPLRVHGIALALQRVAVDLDRPGFALNPSACGPLNASAQLTGDGGQTAAPTTAVTYSGCGAKPFQPRLDAHLFGDVQPGGHPGMHVDLFARDGDSNMKSATVILPEGVAADLKHIKNTCTQEQFDAVGCPGASRVGSAVAKVSITDEPITGDVFLLKVPGQTLPGLGLSFTGRFAQRVTSLVKVNADGRLSVQFPSIPDLPLRALTIDVAGGATGPLQLADGVCAAATRWDGTFTAQGGQTATAQIGLRCAAQADVVLADARGLSVRLFDFGGRHLRSLKATLPTGYRFISKAAARKSVSWARLDGATAKLAFTSRSVTATVTGTAATTIRIKVGGPGVQWTNRKKKAPKKATVALRLGFTDGAVQTQSISAPLK